MRAQSLASLPAMVQGVWTEDPLLQLESTKQFRKLLSIGALRARARLKRFSLNTNRSTPASPRPHTPTPRPRRAGPAD